jgi:uncharacterized RDD family membrane protein YckC
VSNQDWVPPPPGEGGGTGYEPPHPSWGPGQGSWDIVPPEWSAGPGTSGPSGWSAPSGGGRRLAPDGTPITAFGARTAQWWRRVVAIIIDGVLLLIVNQIVSSVGQSSGAETVLRDVTSVALALLYYGYLNGVVGQTVGKMVMGIRTADRDTGAPIGFWRGVGRYLVVAVLTLCFFVPEIIDGLLPLRDPLRQSLHDKAVRSVVVATH